MEMEVLYSRTSLFSLVIVLVVRLLLAVVVVQEWR